MAGLQKQEKERNGWEYTKENWSGWVKKEKKKKKKGMGGKLRNEKGVGGGEDAKTKNQKKTK